MLRRRDPLLDDDLELLGGHARVRGGDDFHQGAAAAGHAVLRSPARTDLYGSFSFHSGCSAASAFTRSMREQRAGNTRAARPRACRRCRTWRCVRPAARIRRPFLGDRRHEGQDGLLRLAVIPRRQWIRGFGDGVHDSKRASERAEDESLVCRHDTASREADVFCMSVAPVERSGATVSRPWLTVACRCVLLPRHGDTHDFLRPDEVVGVLSRIVDGDLHSLDAPGELAAVRLVVFGHRCTRVHSHIAAVVA